MKISEEQAKRMAKLVPEIEGVTHLSGMSVKDIILANWKDNDYIQTPEPKPFTWEDRELLRGRWVRNKNTGNEYVITMFIITNSNSWIGVEGTYLSPDGLVDAWEFIDGSVCGLPF